MVDNPKFQSKRVLNLFFLQIKTIDEYDCVWVVIQLIMDWYMREIKEHGANYKLILMF